MSATPSSRIDAADRLRLERAVVAAREQAGADLCVAAVGACHDYADARWRCAVLLAALALLGLAAFAPPLPLLAYLGAQALALATGLALARTGPVLRAFTAPAALEARARECADRIFAAQPDPDGAVLLFVALLERRVIALAGDAARQALAPGRSFGELTTPLRQGLARGELLGGLLAALESSGDLLPAAPAGLPPSLPGSPAGLRPGLPGSPAGLRPGLVGAPPAPPRLVVLEDGPLRQ